MKKSGNSFRGKKILSIRRYLPSSMCARYDAVRNFAPVKAVGMGVMVLIGVFGVLLATQTVSPTSSASVNEVTVVQAVEGMTASKVSESGGELVFDIDIVGSGRLADPRPINYYTVNSTSAVCSQSTVVSREPAPPRTRRVVSIYDSVPAAGTGGQHTAAFASNAKSVCVRVRHAESVRLGRGSQIRISWGFYSIAVNRAATPTTTTTTTPTRVTTPNFTVSGVDQTGYEVSFVVASTDRRVPTSVQVYRATGSSVTCPTSSGSYPHNASLASTYPGGTGRVYRVAVLGGTNMTRNICVKVAYSQNGNKYETHGAFPVNASSTPFITIVKGGDREYRASASYVAANSWENVVNSSRTCTESSFVRQGSKVQGVQNGSSYTVPESAGTDQNGQYVCFRVRGTNGVWGFKSTVINTVAIATAPEVTARVALVTVPPATSTSHIVVTADSDQNIAKTHWFYIVVENSVSNDYSNTGTTDACERLFSLNPIRQSQIWRASGLMLAPINGDAKKAAIYLDLSHGGRFVCIRAVNDNGRDFTGRLLPTASTPAPTPVQPVQRPPVTTTPEAEAEEEEEVVPDAPTIRITSNDREYTASASDVDTSTWQYVIKSSSACAERDFSGSPQSGKSYTVPESAGTDQNGQYVCFRVRGTGTDGIYGFRSTVINVTAVVPDAPTIRITSNDREYTASASDVDTSTWQYVIKSSSACAERDFSGSPQSGKSYTVPESAGTDQNGQYVCFRVRGTGTDGIYGFRSTVINVTAVVPDAPTIRITSNDREYTASASDVDTSTWQYVIKSSSACAERDFSGSPQSGKSYTVPESAGTDQNGQYVCFRVRGTGTDGIYGFRSTVINVTAVVPDAPTIRITSNDREYTASASDVDTSTWQYVIKSSSACAERDFSGSPQSGKSYTVPESAGTDQNGQYVCFRVRGTGTDGIYGFRSTVINVTAVVPDAPTEEGGREEDATEVGLRVDDAIPDGGKQDAASDIEEIATTGGDDNERNWSQLAGYLLMAGAALGIARVLIVKKYKRMG